MSINPVFSSARQGIQSGIQQVEKGAATLASEQAATGSQNYADTVRAVTDLNAGERQVQASAKVMKSADDVLGTLIDTLA